MEQGCGAAPPRIARGEVQPDDGVALIRFARFLAWAGLASIPVIYWTRSELVWVFGPYGMPALWWFCGFAVACSLVVLVKFRPRPRRRPAVARPGVETPRRRGGESVAWGSARGR